MHEMTLCRNLLTTILKHTQNTSSMVQSIQLNIGQLALIDTSSLQFAFDVLARDTAAENAELQFTVLAGKGRCDDCDLEFGIEAYYEPCPHCLGHQITILQGEEMTIQSMVLR